MQLFGEKQLQFTLPKESEVFKNEEDEKLEAHSPIPGVIERVLVSQGEQVKQGQALIVMIAMKMEYIIRSVTLVNARRFC